MGYLLYSIGVRFARYIVAVAMPMCASLSVGLAQQGGVGTSSGGATGTTGTAVPARAATYDPGDYYYQAYTLHNNAEGMANRMNHVEAIKACMRAELYLQMVTKDFPNWNPGMVQNRLRTVQSSVVKWKEAATQRAKDLNRPTPEWDGGTPPTIPPPTRGTSAVEVAAPTGSNSAPPTPQHPDYSAGSGPVSPTGESTDSIYDQLEREILKLKMENKALVRAMADTRREMEKVMSAKVSAETGEKVYQEQIQKLRKQLKDAEGALDKERKSSNKVITSLHNQLNAAQAKLDAEMAERKKAEAHVARLQGQLTEAEAQLREVSAERDQLRTERDQLVTLIEANNPDRIRGLLDKTITLTNELQKAKTRIAELETMQQDSAAQNEANLQELDNLRADVSNLQTSLSNLRNENVGYKRRITELNTKLTNAEAELDRLLGQTTVDPIVVEENRILKSAVRKQLRALTVLTTSRELLEQSYKRLKLSDPILAQAIKGMAVAMDYDSTSAEEAMLTPMRAEYESVVTAPSDVPNTFEGDTLGVAAVDGILQQGGGRVTEQEAHDNLTTVQREIQNQMEFEALARAAAESFSKERFVASEQLYRTLIDMQNDSVSAHVNLGFILLHRNELTESIKYLNRAILLNRESALAYFYLGLAHYHNQQMREARIALEMCLRLEPGSYHAHLYLGNIEADAGKNKEAIRHFEDVIRLEETQNEALYNLSQLFYTTKDYPKAKYYYDTAVRNGALPDLAFEEVLRAIPDPKPEKVVLPPATKPAMTKPSTQKNNSATKPATSKPKPSPTKPNSTAKPASKPATNPTTKKI